MTSFMKIEQHAFPLKVPFNITGYTFTTTDAVQVSLHKDGQVGRGEAIGMYYKGETAESMVAQLEAVAGEITSGLTRAVVQELLPSGGARNALDCALWDLTCKLAGRTIWDLLDIKPKQLTTVATLGIESPAVMAEGASAFSEYPHLKIKLSGDDPIARLEAIRAVRPDATLIIDVNQGWSFKELQEYTPACKKLGVTMIEQPLPRGDDHELEGYKSSVPLGADESCIDLSEYRVAASRYDVINIKLDKCGGLTEGLELVKCARRDGKGLMVGNMTGTSLSMAPAYVIGQHCQFVDIDGPILLKRDIENGLEYKSGGLVGTPTRALWG